MYAHVTYTNENVYSYQKNTYKTLTHIKLIFTKRVLTQSIYSQNVFSRNVYTNEMYTHTKHKLTKRILTQRIHCTVYSISCVSKWVCAMLVVITPSLSNNRVLSDNIMLFANYANHFHLNFKTKILWLLV
jgi:hypothetical protein